MEISTFSCKKCNTKLCFKGLSAVCTCSSCGMPHALVSGKDGVRYSVSFFPYSSQQGGNMERSFQLKLVEMIRNGTSGKFAIGGNCFQDYCTSIVEGKVYYDGEVSVYNDKMIVGITSIIKTPQRSFLGIGKKSFKEKPFIQTIGWMEVVPVVEYKLLRGDLLMGYRVLFKVNDPQFEDVANELSGMIMERFGFIPEVTLEHV